MIEIKKNLTPFFNDGFSGIIHDAFQQCVLPEAWNISGWDLITCMKFKQRDSWP